MSFFFHQMFKSFWLTFKMDIVLIDVDLHNRSSRLYETIGSQCFYSFFLSFVWAFQSNSFKYRLIVAGYAYCFFLYCFSCYCFFFCIHFSCVWRVWGACVVCVCECASCLIIHVIKLSLCKKGKILIYFLVRLVNSIFIVKRRMKM